MLATRVRRAFGYLDPPLSELSQRLRITVTSAQLNALVAVQETESFTLAARRLGVAQPTVHRAIHHLSQDAGRSLFERTPCGMLGSRAAHILAQAEADLAELGSREAGQIVIGAMPLSRSQVLPAAIISFRNLGRTTPIVIVEGPYNDLLVRLRRGELDFLIGALRDPAPIGDVVQHTLFHDSMVFVAGKDHPVLKRRKITAKHLAEYKWIVARKGSPIRTHFEKVFSDEGVKAPETLIESGSVILMRELLDMSDHLGCISKLQAEAEISRGLMKAVPFDLSGTDRPIGLTMRRGWMPTTAQSRFIEILDKDGTLPAMAQGSDHHLH